MKVLFVAKGNKQNKLSPIHMNQIQSLRNEGVEVDYFLIEGQGVGSYLKAILPLKKRIKTGSYDVIHSHYSLTSYVAALSSRRPLVVSLMGSDVKAKRTAKLLLYLFYKVFWNFVIVKSDDMKETLGFKNLEVIPNGVDMEKFKPIEIDLARYKLNWKLDRLHVLFASSPARPEKNFPLFEKAIEGLSFDHQIDVHVLDRVPNEDIPTYMNAANVVVLTSLWEGSPNVIKEAMACNRPIVTTPVGDTAWLLGDEEGCYVSSFEVKDLTSHIQKAIEFSLSGNKVETRKRINSLGLASNTIARKLINIYNKF